MICLQTDGHGETSIPPYNFVAGDITIRYKSFKPMSHTYSYFQILVCIQVNCTCNMFFLLLLLIRCKRGDAIQCRPTIITFYENGYFPFWPIGGNIFERLVSSTFLWLNIFYWLVLTYTTRMLFILNALVFCMLHCHHIKVY